MRSLNHSVAKVAVPRPKRRMTIGQLAASIIGAVAIGVVAGWISYLVLSPGETSNALAPAEIATVRAADMVAYYESQWLSDPANMAAMTPQQVGELRASAMAERLNSDAGSVYGVPAAGAVAPVTGYAALSSQVLGEMRAAAMAERLAANAAGVYGVPSAGVIDPVATELASTPEGIAQLRAAEMPALYEAQWEDTPEGIAQMRGAELPDLYAAQWSGTPEGIAALRASELPALRKAQWLATPEGIAYYEALYRERLGG